jgi:hypothetical protein
MPSILLLWLFITCLVILTHHHHSHFSLQLDWPQLTPLDLEVAHKKVIDVLVILLVLLL